jgi:hypothetical protein
MENYKWIYVLIVLQATLLGVMLFFGQEIFPTSASSKWAQELSLKEHADYLLEEYLNSFIDRSAPEDKRISGFIVDKIEIIDYDEKGFAFSATISVKPLSVGSTFWQKKIENFERSWITQKTVYAIVSIDDSGRFYIRSVTHGF